jgi:hypothetical protein
VVTKPPTQPPADAAAHLIAIAKKYIGFREGTNNDNPFAARAGFANHQAWCASFVVAVFKEAGLLSLLTTPSPGVDQLAAGFKRAKRWSEYPALGAVVCYGKPSDLNHTGIVVAYDADTITTVEGNTNLDGGREGTGVFLKTRLRRSTNVIGYGYPGSPRASPRQTPPGHARRPCGHAAGSRCPGPHAAGHRASRGFKPSIDGVDLSHWQSGAIDFGRAKAAGVQFVYHKATEGLTVKDAKYASRRKAPRPRASRSGPTTSPARPARAAPRRRSTSSRSPPPSPATCGRASTSRTTAASTRRSCSAGSRTSSPSSATRSGSPRCSTPTSTSSGTPAASCGELATTTTTASPRPRRLGPLVDLAVLQRRSRATQQRPGIGNCDINTLFPGFDLNRLILQEAS